MSAASFVAAKLQFVFVSFAWKRDVDCPEIRSKEIQRGEKYSFRIFSFALGNQRRIDFSDSLSFFNRLQDRHTVDSNEPRVRAYANS